MEVVLAVSGQEPSLIPPWQSKSVTLAPVVPASPNIPALLLRKFQNVQKTDRRTSFVSKLWEIKRKSFTSFFAVTGASKMQVLEVVAGTG